MPKTSNTFADRVRTIVKRIPMGKTLTYKDIAKKAGNENAARAVARIMAANYDPEIPCHRVIRTDGGLGGYNRGGIKEKRRILLEEGVRLT
jgi:methylated-DNA-[protein]-cysteine S-methyltransferase